MPPILTSRRTWALAVGLVAFATFAPTLRFGFVNWDDPSMILRNPRVTEASPLRLFAEPGVAFLPVRDLVYNLTWRLAGGWGPAFHLVNVVLHALAALAFYGVLLEVFDETAGPAPSAPWRNAVAAGVGGLVFAAHPVHAEAVAWATGMKDPLSAALMLGAFLLYLRAARRAARRPGLACAGALVAFCLAALSKPSALVLPGLMLVYAAVLARERRRAAALAVPFVALALGLAAVAMHVGRASGAVKPRTEAAETMVLSMSGVVASYLRELALPVGLSPLYDVPRLTSLAEGRAWVGLGVVAAFAAAAIAALARARRLFFGMAWFAVALAPYLGIIPISTWKADRYLYVACGGYAIVLGLAAAASLERVAGAGRRAAVGVLWGLAVGAYMVLAVWQAELWSSSERLWRRGLQFAPDDAVANYLMGQALMDAEPGEAAPYFRRAADLRLARAERLRREAGQARDRGEAALADSDEAVARQLTHDAAEALAVEGTAVLQAGQPLAALGPYRRALDLEPDAEWLADLVAGELADAARDLRRRGREREAWAVAKALLGLGERYPSVRRALGRLRQV